MYELGMKRIGFLPLIIWLSLSLTLGLLLSTNLAGLERVNAQEMYTLTVYIDGDGSVILNPAGGVYDEGTVVWLTAFPDPGWQFSGWSWDLGGSNNPESIFMDGNKIVIATFTPILYTLTVNVNPEGSGSVIKNPNQATYNYGQSVLLSANPSSGWTFSGWSGDLGGSINPESITMDSNKTVTAIFTEIQYTLTVNIDGDGSVILNPAGGVYDEDQTVWLTAIPDSGWQFSGWSGDISGSRTQNPKSIIMNSDKTVNATFTQTEYTLSVIVSPTEGGLVTKNPEQQTYQYNDVVELTAVPNAGWSFSGWGGDLGGSSSPEYITIDGDKTVNATFTQSEYILTVNTVGSGSVTRNPYQEIYHYGDTVQLTANATAGWSFSGWGGDLSGSTNPDYVTIYDDTYVIAFFTQNEYTLTTITSGSGSISKSPDQATYNLNDIVALTATPSPGWSFSGWSGDLTGSTNPADLTITGDMTVTATFTEIQYTLTVNIIGDGSVNLNPAGGVYDEDQTVWLTAIPASGWSFDGWGGDLSGSTNPDYVTIYDNTYVIAIFTQNEYTLTVDTVGSGSVTKNPDQTTYNFGDSVQLIANPAGGWTFDHWELDSTNVGNENPYTVTMNVDHSLTAVFKDITLPKITITSPINVAYPSSDVLLKFSVDKVTSWIGYSLDAKNNITISGNTTISGLSEGSHSIVVYANDTLGNTGISDKINFQVDTTPPTITILSPQETSYPTSEITLNFDINELVNWTAYSLDGEKNVTITGSIIISGLLVGSHNIIVFANDTIGNIGSSDVVQFIVSAATIDTTPPTVIVNSPTNTTYDTNQISLSFTVNEEPTIKFYSLDGKANTTVVESIVLSDLSNGEHRLIMYAEDLAGNIGVSNVIFFTIMSENDSSSQLWIVGVIGAIAGVGFIFSFYIAYNLFKSRHTEIEKIQNSMIKNLVTS